LLAYSHRHMEEPESWGMLHGSQSRGGKGCDRVVASASLGRFTSLGLYRLLQYNVKHSSEVGRDPTILGPSLRSHQERLAISKEVATAGQTPDPLRPTR
jgi:hypothetical protein